MTEKLKSLKDLKESWINFPEIDLFNDELKAEAVKWLIRYKDTPRPFRETNGELMMSFLI